MNRQMESFSAFLRLAQKHHPDKGGDEVSFQLIQERESFFTLFFWLIEIYKFLTKNAYSKIIAEQPSEKKEKANRLVLSKFGPTKNDECVIGNDQQFQKRRNDIYELVRSMSKSCPGRWEMAGHGFIQFVKSERDSYHKITKCYFCSTLCNLSNPKYSAILEWSMDSPNFIRSIWAVSVELKWALFWNLRISWPSLHIMLICTMWATTVILSTMMTIYFLIWMGWTNPSMSHEIYRSQARDYSYSIDINNFTVKTLRDLLFSVSRQNAY